MGEGSNVSQINLCDVPVGRRIFSHPLEVFTVYQTLNAALDHIDIRSEASRELRQCFGHQLRMGEGFALSRRC